MTTAVPTITQELEEARAALLNAEDEAVNDRFASALGSVIEARLAIERALKMIQHARCDAVAALDKF